MRVVVIMMMVCNFLQKSETNNDNSGSYIGEYGLKVGRGSKREREQEKEEREKNDGDFSAGMRVLVVM